MGSVENVVEKMWASESLSQMYLRRWGVAIISTTTSARSRSAIFAAFSCSRTHLRSEALGSVTAPLQ